ncbi:nuclear transport factor 2 family protein [Candidatus Peregrinibacteria bacterium]|nr:MAG: nuclear transport factor 2 family protein [Candidatus Peregrinibacteria bacterium]
MYKTNINFELLQQLEESLWKAETRFDLNYMDDLLAPDFFEFGRSGRTYTREETLSAKAEPIKATLPLPQFKIHPITDEVFLITYVSEVQYGELERANRSSLWRKINDSWKLQFHQGTAIN